MVSESESPSSIYGPVLTGVGPVLTGVGFFSSRYDEDGVLSRDEPGLEEGVLRVSSGVQGVCDLGVGMPDVRLLGGVWEGEGVTGVVRVGVGIKSKNFHSAEKLVK